MTPELWMCPLPPDEECPHADERDKLLDLIEQFLKDFNDLRLMDDVAIREPPSKHQRKLRQLCDLVRAFEYNVHLNEGA